MIRKRQDKNQTAIKNALKKIGCKVYVLSNVGEGVPDLLVGYRFVTFLIEVKNKQNWYGKKEAHYQTQKTFRETWNGGIVLTATSPEQIIDELQKQFIMIDDIKTLIETNWDKKQEASK